MKRYSRRLRTFKNPFRGVRRTGRRFNSRRFRGRRIIRRSLARRPLRPEIKYKDYTQVQNLATSVVFSGTLNSSTIDPGTGEGQRIGDSIMIRKLLVKWDWSGAYHGTAETNADNAYPIRVVLWTPRIDYVQALEYMNSALTTTTTMIDFNVVTVHKDFTFLIGYANVLNGVNGYPNGQPTGAISMRKCMTHAIPFPRNAKFPPPPVANNTRLNVDKDNLYFTVIPLASPAALVTQVRVTTRMTYTDN